MESGKTKKLKVLRPVTDRFSSALIYNIHWFAEWSLLYDNEVAKHVTSGRQGYRFKMKAPKFDPLDLNSTIRFLHSFRLVCDVDRICERDVLWLFKFCLIMSATAPLTAHLSIISKSLYCTVKGVLKSFSGRESSLRDVYSRWYYLIYRQRYCWPCQTGEHVATRFCLWSLAHYT